MDISEKNLLIIGYCSLDDGFLYASEALKKMNYSIFFFPYFSYILDNDESRDNKLIDFIINNRIQICLWWNNSIKYENFKIIFDKLPNNINNYFFNWDPFLYNYEKYNSLIWKDIINNKKICYPLMKHVFSCFETEINIFKMNNISYAPPGFDKNISKYIYDKNFECDISIVCTNFYNNISEFPNDATNITRYEIVNKLYENRSTINFHIYGPENFKNIFPDCYKGFIKYKDCNKVFSNSKINLSIHPIINELNNTNSKEEYLSERVPQILGCKGLLITNSLFSDKLIADNDYIFIDNTIEWYKKIIYIINNSNEFNNIRENGYKKALQYYTWDNWAQILHTKIQID